MIIARGQLRRQRSTGGGGRARPWHECSSICSLLHPSPLPGQRQQLHLITYANRQQPMHTRRSTYCRYFSAQRQTSINQATTKLLAWATLKPEFPVSQPVWFWIAAHQHIYPRVARTPLSPAMERRMTSTTGSSHRSGVPRASIRPPVRQAKPSLARHGSTASRHDRSGAISPAESVSSAATTATAGTKRKEREFEADEGGESTNINVVVRCRGRNQREVKENSTVVVKTDGAKGSIVELSMGPNALSNKTYNFDRVFSPAADQSMVFDEVVKPILDEVSGAAS